MPDLNPKQEKFAQVYVETSNASEAYRQAYSVEHFKPESVWTAASKLLSTTKVAQRVMELQKHHAERHSVTVDLITKELNEAREMAVKKEKPEVMISASNSKAKLHGLITDKVDSKATHDITDGFKAMMEKIDGKTRSK